MFSVLHYRNADRWEFAMKKHLLHQNDYKLPYMDFINQVKRTKVEDVSDSELITLLKRKLPEQNFSIIKELILRLMGFTLSDTQLSAAYSLLGGNIAELASGEVLRKVKESITGEDAAYTKQCKLQGKNICSRCFGFLFLFVIPYKFQNGRFSCLLRRRVGNGIL